MLAEDGALHVVEERERGAFRRVGPGAQARFRLRLGDVVARRVPLHRAVGLRRRDAERGLEEQKAAPEQIRGGGGRERLDALPASAHDDGNAAQKKRDVRAEPRGDFAQFGLRERVPAARVQQAQRRRRVGASAAEPRAVRHAFFEPPRDGRARGNALAEELGRAQDEVARVRRHAGRVARERIRRRVRRFERVAERNRRDERDERVKAVRTRSRDGEHEIDFRGREKGDGRRRFHGPPIKRVPAARPQAEKRLLTVSPNKGFFAFQQFSRQIMKVSSSLKNLKLRHPNCQVVRRKGRIYVINKTHPRYKARQG